MLRVSVGVSARTASALLLVASGTHVVFAADFLFGDDFETTPVCSAGPTPSIAATMSPDSLSTRLDTHNHYLIKIRSCGYSGTVAFTPNGAPSSWIVTADPGGLVMTTNGTTEMELDVAVPTDGDGGIHAVNVDAVASGANTVSLGSLLDVINEYIVIIPDGTGSGDHHFPAAFALKAGAKLRILDNDTVAPHRIHGDGSEGFLHQLFDMTAGQEYDITVLSSANSTHIVYCHDHLTGAGTMTISVHD